MKQTRKEKILIVDDSELNRAILADMLGEEYDIVEAENGLEGVAILQKMGPELSLVLLDIVMPQMDGFGVLDTMNQNHWIDDIPVIMISAESGSSHIERAYELGVTDFIARPFDALIVHRRVVNTILLYAKQKKLVGMVADQIYEKERQGNLMIDILSHIVEFRNGESGLHVLHVRSLTELLLRRLSQKTDRYRLTPAEIAIITTASALHDIGKIAIDENILNKPGRLTDEEFAIMKTHTTVGAEMLENLPIHQHDPLVNVAYQICRWHHERYDGRAEGRQHPHLRPGGRPGGRVRRPYQRPCIQAALPPRGGGPDDLGRQVRNFQPPAAGVSPGEFRGHPLRSHRRFPGSAGPAGDAEYRPGDAPPRRARRLGAHPPAAGARADEVQLLRRHDPGDPV